MFCVIIVSLIQIDFANPEEGLNLFKGFETFLSLGYGKFMKYLVTRLIAPSCSCFFPSITLPNKSDRKNPSPSTKPTIHPVNLTNLSC